VAAHTVSDNENVPVFLPGRETGGWNFGVRILIMTAANADVRQRVMLERFVANGGGSFWTQEQFHGLHSTAP
jgi:hypothetical protein